MKVTIFTLFPEIFPGPIGVSITKRAIENQNLEIEPVNIRNYALNKWGSVDDEIYGMGPGMLLSAEVVSRAIDGKFGDEKPKMFCTSARGKIFDQKMAREIAKESEIAIICPRFEGIDQRAIEYYDIEEISIGNFILSGGELAAMAMIDAISRNLHGILGDEESLREESFGDGKDGNEYNNLLEYPQYTRPAIWRDMKVPEVLLSGNHKKIAEWRLEMAKNHTEKRNG